MSASSITSGIYPPISDGGTAQRIPLAVSWLDGPVVAVGTLVGDAPVTTDPLPEGVYLIWTDGPTWINAGGDDVTVDPAETGDAIASFPLTALLEQVDALEALQDVAFDDEAVGALETFML